MHCSFDSAAAEECSIDGGAMDLIVGELQYVLLVLGLNDTGFIVSELVALEDSEVYLVYDEKFAPFQSDERLRGSQSY